MLHHSVTCTYCFLLLYIAFMNGFVVYSLKVCDVAMAPTLTMSWLYDVCTMLVGIRDYANIHYKLGISVIYFFKL